MAVFTLFRDPVLIVASEEEKYGGCHSSDLLLPAPPPFLLHVIWVHSPQAAKLKALPLGYAILLSPECCLPPFLTLGFYGSLLPHTRNANSFLRDRLTVSSCCSSKASVYSTFY